MTPVSGSSRLERSARADGTARPGTAAAPDNAALLPAPASECSGMILNDAMSLLYKLNSKSKDADREAGSNELKITAAERREQSRQMSEAIDKQIKSEQGKGFFKQISKLCVDAIQLRPDLLITKTVENCKDIANDPKFWKDLAKGAMTVAKVAAAAICVVGIVAGPGVVGTIGFAVAVFSACAMVESELQIMEKLGVDAKAATYTRLGMAAATAVVSFGGLATAGANAAKAGAQAANAAKNASQLQQAAKIAGTAAKWTKPIADTTAKGAATAQKAHEMRTQGFVAESEEHRFGKEALDRRMKQQIKEAISSIETHEKTLGMIKQAIVARQQTTMNLASAIGGRA